MTKLFQVFKQIFNKIFHRKWVVIALVLLLLIALSIIKIRQARRATYYASSANPTVDQRIPAPKPLATTDINKDFFFNTKGTPSYKVGYTIQSAELDDQIILNGQKANAVQGRNFLILNLKITNNNNQGLQLNTRDYTRVSTTETDWLAPDIYNDPVEVQAISTKYTRVGFPVNQSDKSFKLQVGEISGDKTTIDIKF
jgi:hypothetical protein